MVEGSVNLLSETDNFRLPSIKLSNGTHSALMSIMPRLGLYMKFNILQE